MREFIVPDGMAAAVFHDKYARRKDDGSFQTWRERVTEMVDGNISLRPEAAERQRAALLEYAVAGVLPFSGRHLQHGDTNQRNDHGEKYLNCTSAMFSWASFLLLMKGCFSSGTLVKMADGKHKEIQDINAGELVFSWSEVRQDWVTAKVVQTHRNKPKQMVRVTFADGHAVVCTFDHLFLAADGHWWRAIDCAGKDILSQRGLFSEAA